TLTEKKFTKEQQSVVDFREGSLLVSAAAGSGKTAVLVERILGLLLNADDPVSLDQLVVMTFTRAAAAEMKGRIADAIDKKLAAGGLDESMRAHLETQRTILPRALVSTIDAICQHLIRQYFQQLDIDPGFRVADENELTLLRTDIMKKLLEEKYEEADPAFCDLARRFSGGGTEDRVSSLVERFCRKAEAAAWPVDFLDRCGKDAELEKAGEVEKTAWFTDMLKKEAADARDMAQLALSGKAASEAPGGWTPYAPLFADLASFYEGVREAALTGGKEAWDALHALASGSYKWELSRVRNVPGSDAEEKEREKKIIELLRDTSGIFRRYQFSYGELASRTAGAAGDVLVLCDLAKTFMERFREMKQEKNLVDFSDLEHLCLELLYDGTGEDRKPSAVADELASRFREIMIDEYQDSSDVQ
ncbi:MAG: UvrD-helicase domain-containing protein, partial [Lachnospiraceae bacterium]|nr:UvrD-helicase domain-containing protein [Candidatus Hippenecus merdae]